MPRPFTSLYTHGLARVAAAVPHLRPAEPAFNVERTIGLARRAAEANAALVAFPELGISAYAIDDLFHQEALTDAVVAALGELVEASRELAPVIVVGAPLRAEGGVFNCGVVVHRGRVLGVVPKSYLPEYREYYEERQFRAAREALGDTVELLGADVPFGPKLLFAASDLRGFVAHVEICEDLWTPIPPSTYGALAGASVLVNLSASNITVGKADYRRVLCQAHSARLMGGYIYTAAGEGESTTDLAWDGQALICENGDLIVEAERFAKDEQLICADIDLGRIAADRSTTSSYGDSVADHKAEIAGFRRVELELGISERRIPLRRKI